MRLTEKERVKLGRKLMSGSWEPFQKVDLSNTPIPPAPWMTRVYKNNKYIVMINDYAETTVGYAIRAMIQALSGEPVRNWMDLQRVKNEVFGVDVIAIEYYPKQSELVNNAHIYWLWIYEPGQIPIPLRQEKD
jgi:hypothetical protein